MRTAIFDHAVVSASDELLTTGEAAHLLGVSRQTVVRMTDRGDLPYETSGVHRRVRRSDVEAVRASQGRMTRDQRRSLWLSMSIAGKVVADPETALNLAKANLERLRAGSHRGLARRWLDVWDELLNGPLDRLLTTLTSPAPHARELRQNNPFAGLLSDDERQQILDSFRRNEGR